VIVFPVFLLAKDCGEVELFGSIEELQSQLELIDVDNGEYLAWDARGTRLELTCQPPLWLRLEPASRTNPTELWTVLLEYARSRGIDLTKSQLNADPVAFFHQIAMASSVQSRRYPRS
jgi:hypothetical protein